MVRLAVLMEALITFLEREARLFNNVPAALIVAAWKRDRLLTDGQIYQAQRIKREAAQRERERLRKLAVKTVARASAAKVANAESARDRLAVKLAKLRERSPR